MRLPTAGCRGGGTCLGHLQQTNPLLSTLLLRQAMWGAAGRRWVRCGGWLLPNDGSGQSPRVSGSVLDRLVGALKWDKGIAPPLDTSHTPPQRKRLARPRSSKSGVRALRMDRRALTSRRGSKSVRLRLIDTYSPKDHLRRPWRILPDLCEKRWPLMRCHTPSRSAFRRDAE